MTRAERDAAWRRRVAIATVVGLLARLAWLIVIRPQPVSDYEYIHRFADGLFDHHQYGYPVLDSGRMPGYPMLLAALMVVSRSVFWLSAASAVFSTLLVPATASLARALGLSPATAVAAAFIVALEPTFVFYGPLLASEHLFSVCLVAGLAVAAGTGASASPVRRAAVAGVLIGLAAMGRAEALVYLPVVAAIVLVRVKRARWVATVALLACALIVVAPWWFRNRVLIGPGAGLSTSAGPTFYYAHNDRWNGWFPLRGTPLEGLTQLKMQTRGYELGFDYIRHAGAGRLLKDVWIGTSRLYSPLSSPFALRWSTMQAGAGPDDFSRRQIPGLHALELVSGAYGLVALAALGSWLVRRQFPPGAFAILWSLIAVHWVTYAVVFLGESRYRYFAEVLFCVLAAQVWDLFAPRVRLASD
jgi:4-amino-4-deoxy-L-arabinose transferase-like glycosyltransferase